MRTLDRIKKIQSLLDEKEYLNAQLEKLPSWRKFAHFWVLVVNSFRKNRGPVRAASLAYSTLLALIPVLALVVSISTGFLQNDEGKTINMLLDRLIMTAAPQLNLIQEGDTKQVEMNRSQVVERIRGFIDKVNSGTLGVTAGMVLVFISIMVLSTVETTFNDMWGVTRGRTWSARIVQYWAAITLGPMFLVTAVALTTGAQIQKAKAEGKIPPPVEAVHTNAPGAGVTNAGIAIFNSDEESAVGEGTAHEPPLERRKGFKAKIDRASQWLLQAPILGALILKLMPFVVLSIFLMLLYRLMPATKVRWEAAVVGGFVGGTLLQLNNLFNVIYISRVVTYSKIYGSLGIVPIFLVGLYFSWMIVLFGAQVAYAFQNRAAYVQERQAESINQRGREFVALRLMTFIGQRFHQGAKPPSRNSMTKHLGIPMQLACSILSPLVTVGLLIEVPGDETAYVPGRPLDQISVEDIISALRVGHGTELATSDEPARALVRQEYERIVLAEMQTAGAVTLQSLVQRAESLQSETTPAAT